MGGGADETRAQSFEHVLANINKLNRNLEAVIAVSFRQAPVSICEKKRRTVADEMLWTG